MFAVGVCDLPETGGSTFVLIAGVFLLVAGVIVTRWVQASARRMSVVVAPLVLLGGLVLAPQVADPCAPATTTVPSASTTTVPSATTTVPSATTTVPPASTTTVALTCATGGSCAVGDMGPGGGTIFYVDETRDVGSQYLEAACAGWQNNCDATTADPQSDWGCFASLISGADGTGIWTGEQNTTDIVAGCTTPGIAADLADDLVLGGQSDWFLPSKYELNQMYIQQTAIGGFSTDFYWSSSEFDDYFAWYQIFYDGGQYYDIKDFTFYVRPVRAF
ncbi:MAG: DUF1566 domain-containing protein [Actinomycetes bacterium]